MTTILDHFKEITERITDLCQSHHRPCSERVAAYTLRAVTLDKSTVFEFESSLTAGQMRNLIEITANRILEGNNPSMETIKMQAAYDAILQYTGNEGKREEDEHNKENEQLADAVMEYGARLKSDGQIPGMYSLLFQFMAANAGQEAPLDRQTEREITQALQSAFPKNRIMMFAQMSDDARRQQLSSLINITLGIRLFNRYLGKGGASIPDIPELLETTSSVLLEDLRREHDQVAHTAAVYNHLIQVEYTRPGTISSPIQRLHDEYRNRQQYESYIDEVMSQVSKGHDLILSAITAFDHEIQSLQGQVNTRQAVPRQQVFPIFDSVGRLWRALQQDLKRLQSHRTVLQELLKFKANYTPVMTPEDLAMAQEGIAGTGAGSAVLMETSGEELGAEKAMDPEVELVKGVGTAEHGSSTALRGYCPWTIAKRDGLLIPGDYSLGLVRYHDQLYAFADRPAMDAFMASPSSIIASISDKVKQAPELIHLLDLHRHYPDVQGLNESVKADIDKYGETNKMVDTGTDMGDGADLYPHPAKAQPWNIWDIRKEALHLVKIRNMRTHSTQTSKSYANRSNETQTYPPKDNSCQSGKDKAVNTVRRKRLMTGLRGAQGHKPTIITLEM